MTAPAPNDRIAILSHKIKEAQIKVARARRTWEAAQSRYLQMTETEGAPETFVSAAWVDASATYEVWLDAQGAKAMLVRSLKLLRRQTSTRRGGEPA